MRIFRNKKTKKRIEVDENKTKLLDKLEKDDDYQELMFL